MEGTKPMQKLTMEEVKARELDLLYAFDEYAKENGFSYSLGYGTLLGAARHKGFIPWDDDIDVIVPRPQYNRIVEDAKKGIDVRGYKFIGYEVDGFPMPFMKLVDPKVTVKDHATKDRIPLHLWIDVFPIDVCFADIKAFDKQYSKAYVCRSLIKVGNYKFIGAGKSRKTRILKMIAMPFVTLLRLNNLAERQLQKLLKKDNTPWDEAETYANLAWGPYGHGERISREMISDYVPMEFEDGTFPAITGWEKWLSGLYGEDFMQLPPEEKRISHGVEAWVDIIEPSEKEN